MTRSTRGKCLIFGPVLISFLAQIEQQVSLPISEVSQRDARFYFCGLGGNSYLYRAVALLVRESTAWPCEVDYFYYPQLTDEGEGKRGACCEGTTKAPCDVQV